MAIIQDILTYYKMGFFRILDFKNSSCRIELNCFVFAYVIFLVCFVIVDSILIAILNYIYKEQINIIAQFNNIVFFIFNLIHILPLFSIIKRRLNDVVPIRSRILFLGLIIMYIVYVSAPLLAADTNSDAAFALFKLFTALPYIIISFACGICVLLALIYLMSKKGNLNTAPLDSDLF